MPYYIAGSCKQCGQNVWVNLDGSCANGHDDSCVNELYLPNPQPLTVDQAMALMERKQDTRWVDASNIASSSPYEAYKALSALEPKITNPIDLHFVYNALIKCTYRLRDSDPVWLQWCTEYCKRDIALFPKFRSAWLADERARDLFGLAMAFQYGDKREIAKKTKAVTSRKRFDVRIPSFQQLAIIYEKQGNIMEALEVAREATAYKLSDGTEGGFAGRIARLEKKLEKVSHRSS